MKTVKSMPVMILALALLVLMSGCSLKAVNTEKQTSKTVAVVAPVTIGITQIVSHPSLDLIRQGILDGLKAAGYETGKNLTVDFQNAEGSMETAQLIAQGFESAEHDLNIGITTPCAQTLYQTVKSGPVIFSAVTDPVGAKLSGDKITGVSDRTPVAKQLELLKGLMPDAKVVGMVYNSSEQNSVVQVEDAKRSAAQLGLEIKAVAITGTNDMALALDAVLKSSDVFYAHVDNTIASAFPLLIQKTNEAKCPVIGAVSQYVTDGAVAADGIDNYDIGLQTAAMAVKILNGAKVSEIPFETVQHTKLTLNETAAKAMGITFSEALMAQAAKAE